MEVDSELMVSIKSSLSSNTPSSNIETTNEVVVTPAVNMTLYGPDVYSSPPVRC